MTFSIPADINSLDRLAAARFYHGTLRWAVHPLAATRQGRRKRAWQEAGAQGLAQPCRLRGDAGNAGPVVRSGCQTQHRLRGAPAVRPRRSRLETGLRRVGQDMAGIEAGTFGGAHANARAAARISSSSATTSRPRCSSRRKPRPRRINDAVTAELYFDGLNIVLSPSVHKSGHTYSWEVTGDIPEVKWERLCQMVRLHRARGKEARAAVEGKAVVVQMAAGLAHARPGRGHGGTWSVRRSASIPTSTSGPCVARGMRTTPVRHRANRDPTPSSSTSRKPCRRSTACTPTARAARSRTCWSGRNRGVRESSPPVARRNACGRRVPRTRRAGRASCCRHWPRPQRVRHRVGQGDRARARPVPLRRQRGRDRHRAGRHQAGRDPRPHAFRADRRRSGHRHRAHRGNRRAHQGRGGRHRVRARRA